MAYLFLKPQFTSKMQKSILLIIGLFLSYQNHVTACGCNVERPFLQTSINAKLIAVVEIQDYISYNEMMGEEVAVSMSVKVKKVLKGVEYQSEITVWGNNGLMCSPYLDIFEPGTKWIMAFRDAPIEAYGNAKSAHYGLSNCGEHFMKVETSVVRGLIKNMERYQSMTIATLKANLDIINREHGNLDVEKCHYIAQLYDFGVDTIGVFENRQVNNVIRFLPLKVNFEMSRDDDFPNYYEYIKNGGVNRQLFIYWQFKGRIYVKQIDNILVYDAVEISDVGFFDAYFENKNRFRKERLKLPGRKIQRQYVPQKINPIRSNKVLAENINYMSTAKVIAPPPEHYLLQSIQFFINGEVFLRDFDTRLFNKGYNPYFYKENQKSFVYNWLGRLMEETENLVKINERAYIMFRQYKRMK